MANLSNINNKFIVTDGGQALVNQTAAGFNPDADDLIVGNLSGNTGITIASGSSAGNYGSIYFADGAGSSTASKAGYIRYEQNTSKMTIGINAVEKIAIDISGNVGIGTNIPGTKLSIASGVAKTSTSTPEVLYLGQSNEATNYSTLQVYTKGGASQADRKVFFQTIETGVANAGSIILQPSGGNVGIGITTPTRQLSVLSRIACVVSGTTANAAILFGDDDDDSQGQVRYNNSDDSMELRTNSTAFLTATSTGNVGIGTTLPGNSSLSIHFDDSYGAYGPVKGVNVTNETTTRDAGFVQLSARYNNSGGNTFYKVGGMGGGKETALGDGQWGGFLSFFTTSDGTAGAASGMFEHMRITADGNVGIGTTSPATKLQVNGTTAIINSAAELWLGDSLGGGDGGFIKWNSGSDYLYIGNSYNSAYNTNIVIANTGNVGISNTSPNNKLEISDTGVGTGSTHLKISRGAGATAVQRIAGIKMGNTAANDGSNWIIQADSSLGYFDNAQLQFIHNAGGTATERLVIESDGTVRAKTGSIVVDTVGQGIFLGGTAVANKLNHYEKGTWTPVIAHHDGSGVIPCTINQAGFVRVGQSVTLTAYITGINPNGNAGGSGLYYGFRGFPYAPSLLSTWNMVYVTAPAVTSYGGYISSASMYFNLVNANGSNGSPHANGATVNGWGSNWACMISCTYIIA